jgi:DNA-directed RNA polymerase specialized sigma24 family protein
MRTNEDDRAELEDIMNTHICTSPVFATTQWSLVLKAGEEPSEQADEALARLCETYWYPLYFFIRRSGWSQHDAEDLTQEFFARLLSKRYLSAVDRTKGKFRSFLLASFQHFVANQRRDARAQKRGGDCTFISLNDESAEQRYLQRAADLPAEKLFEQQWAMTLLDQVVARLRSEFLAADKVALFDELKIFLTGDKRSASYAALATKLETTEPALKMAVSRMRKRYGELLREEIANTVSKPSEVEEELRALFAALS